MQYIQSEYRRELQKRRLKKKIALLKTILLIVAAVTILFAYAAHPTVVTYVRVEPVEVKKEEPPKPKVEKKYTQSQLAAWRAKQEKEVKSELAKHFTPEESRIALAIIKKESQLVSNAVGYNCFYDEKGYVHGTRVAGAKSTHCKKGHEQYAWSLDCGMIQRNYVGVSECPAQTKNLAWNIQEMKNLYDSRGWQPWVAYTSGAYAKYLD